MLLWWQKEVGKWQCGAVIDEHTHTKQIFVSLNLLISFQRSSLHFQIPEKQLNLWSFNASYLNSNSYSQFACLASCSLVSTFLLLLFESESIWWVNDMAHFKGEDVITSVEALMCIFSSFLQPMFSLRPSCCNNFLIWRMDPKSNYSSNPWLIK